MPKTFVCTNPASPHTFQEGSEDYKTAMTFPDNRNMRALLWCHRCRYTVVENRGTVREERYALVTLVADVSGSMFEPTDVGNGVTSTRIAQVIDSLADVLRDLALPLAGTAKSLLIGVLTFGSRPHWLDLRAGTVTFSNEPALLTASEFVQHALGIATGQVPPAAMSRAEEIQALRTTLSQAFTKASELCGQGTDYEAALNTCNRLLLAARDDNARAALRGAWKAILRDSNNLPYLRTIFYTDGAPTAGIVDAEDLKALSRRIFPDEQTTLIVSSFVSNQSTADANAEALLRDMSSTCPVHKADRCMFPGEAARRFRDIIRMASGGAGFCPRCLPRRG